MIELPEALTIAGQMRRELAGRVIEYADLGNSPHKFAFYSRLRERYGELLGGKRITDAVGLSNWISLRIEPGYALLLGAGGLRILLHGNGEALPKKRQMLLRFDDGRCLTVSIQMWGFMQLLTEAETAAHSSRTGASPLDRAFTPARLTQFLRGFPDAGKQSIKYFLISGGCVAGIGNGYLHDILFRAGIRPARKVADLAEGECRKLHGAVRKTMADAVAAGGRDTERDLHDRPGRYRCALDARAAGKPCPSCGTPIEKVSFLGGACYFCPECQT